MAIKGSLREAGLADVCQLLSIGQKSGCLSITDRSRFGQIYFDRGRITFATIVNRRDRLGDLLVREGEITHEQLMEAVDAQADDPDRRLGEILLERGHIDRETLHRSIERQIQDAIYYLFTWKRGSFYFEVGKSPGSGEITIAVNPESLLLEGARRIDEWSVIEEKIPSMDLIFAAEADGLLRADEDLTPEQREVARLLDGDRTVQEVAEESGLGEFETGKALYGLLQAGLAFRSGRRSEQPAPEPEDVERARNLGGAFYETDMLDDAEREFRRVLENEPHDLRARHYLALIALRKGDASEAVRRLVTLLETGGPRVGVYLNLAYALRLQRRYSDALRAIADARQIAPDDPRIALAEGATRLAAGELDAAEEALRRFRAGLGDDRQPPARYYHAAALAAAAAGRLDDARERVEEGLRLHPLSPPLHLLAGNIAEAAGDAAEAEAAYRRAAEEDGAIAQAHRNLGDLADSAGRADEALEHYRRAAEMAPDLGDELFARMADLHYRRHEREAAIRCWRRAVELNPENEVARNHLEVVTGVRR